MDTSKSLSQIGLGVRIVKGFSGEGVTTIAQLILMTEREVKRFPNVGEKGLQEIRYALAERGLTLHNPTTEEILRGR